MSSKSSYNNYRDIFLQPFRFNTEGRNYAQKNKIKYNSSINNNNNKNNKKIECWYYW